MLTAAQKEQWLKDLRSGEFKQGTGRLCTIDGDNEYYCCLGVLAHRHSIGFETEQFGILKRKVFYFADDPAGYAGIVPDSLITSPYVIAMNDQGDTFDEIADWIEANVVTKG